MEMSQVPEWCRKVSALLECNPTWAFVYNSKESWLRVDPKEFVVDEFSVKVHLNLIQPVYRDLRWYKSKELSPEENSKSLKAWLSKFVILAIVPSPPFPK
jgi:hypothetical protein